jgi:hypothetical protein
MELLHLLSQFALVEGRSVSEVYDINAKNTLTTIRLSRFGSRQRNLPLLLRPSSPKLDRNRHHEVTRRSIPWSYAGM